MPIPVPQEALEGVDSELLLQSAREWMADALDAYLDDAHRRVVAFAPISLEHLGKAVLASRHPSLLVQLHSSQERSLLALTGHGRAQDRAKLRTIGLKEVLTRVALVIGESPTSPEAREQVIANRNGAVHIGMVSPEASRQVMTIVCRLTQWLLEALPTNATYFYGSCLDTATMLLDERASKIQESVRKNILSSKARFQRIAETIDDHDARVELIAALEARVEDRTDHPNQLMHVRDEACPACKSTGRLSGPLHVDAEGEAEVDDGEMVYHAYWVITFMPDRFQCGACGLQLHSREELEAAELPTNQPLDQDDLDFDPGDLYEPDWESYSDWREERGIEADPESDL